MEVDDLLARAAGSWCGNPMPYEPGLLGAIGLRYREAFNREWSTEDASRALAFEYCVGLIFDADYVGLAGLRDLVESWLTLPGDVTATFPAAAVEYSKNYLPSTVSLYAVSTHVWRSDNYPGPGTQLFNVDIRYSPHYPLHRRWRLSLKRWTEAYPDFLPVGEWINPTGEGPVGVYAFYWGVESFRDTAVDVLAGGEAQGFNTDLLASLREYTASESKLARDFAEPAATAVCDNGYVIANWAAERFGKHELA